MTVMHEREENETLFMETSFCQEYHSNELIKAGLGGGFHPGHPAAWIQLHCNASPGAVGIKEEHAKIYLSMAELDIVIDALQKAKIRAINDLLDNTGISTEDIRLAIDNSNLVESETI